MQFESIRHGQFLVWNEIINVRYNQLMTPNLWAEEPLQCVLQVTSMREDATGALVWVELTCVKDCGRHFFQDISEPNYGLMTTLLGGETPLVEASAHEALVSALDYAQAVSRAYNFEEDIENIYDSIQTGSLRKRRS